MDDVTRRIIDAQVNIAESLKGIRENLKQLNDTNILHCQKNTDEHKNIVDILKTMTDKYWWLIIALIGVIMGWSGFKHYFP